MPTTTTHPPGCYYVNVVTGTIQRQCNPLLASGLAAAGFWGRDGVFATAENAFPTYEAAKQFANTWALNNLGRVPSGIASVAPSVGSAIGNATGLSGLDDLAHRLTEGATWIRVGEFVAGLLIAYVALKALVSPSTGPIARRTVRDTAKATFKHGKKLVK